MDKIIINGNRRLNGEITVQGAKNSVLPILVATLLVNGVSVVHNCPILSDVEATIKILRYLGCIVTREGHTVTVDSTDVNRNDVPDNLMREMRSSIIFLGAILTVWNKAEVGMPGGCPIGLRPIDLHIKALKQMGVRITEEYGYIKCECDRLKGAEIHLDFPSVGATENIMLAAVKAEGTTIISNAAKEPHIVNVATFLNNMGAKITGAGTSTIKIEGVEYLGKCFHEVIPDRIEAGTYIIIGALCGTPLKVDNVIPEHVDSLLSKLEEMGVDLEVGADYVIVSKPQEYKATSIKTAVYPGFPTDLQQPFTVLQTQSNGKSKTTETIWENRFMHIPYLNDLGADIIMAFDECCPYTNSLESSLAYPSLLE